MTLAAIRVLCVEDHRLVGQGIALIVNHEPDMEVVGLAATGEEALNLFRRLRPEVTLMDLRLREMSGLEAIRAIRAEDGNARIVVLTMYEGDEDIHRALRAGAATYLLKDTLSDNLIRVIREVHSGGRPTSPEIESRLAERQAHPTLTQREIAVMELLATGLRNKEIAATLGVSEGTVQVHLRNIFSKLGVHDRTQAMGVAIRRGIVHLK
jgi:two-component system NarL family response regulator